MQQKAVVHGRVWKYETQDAGLTSETTLEFLL